MKLDKALEKAERYRDQLEACVNCGDSWQAISAATGLSTLTAQKYCALLGLHKDNTTTGAKEPDERAHEMKAMRESGKSLSYIGEHFGVSRERVRQIMLHTFPEFLMATTSGAKECQNCGATFRSTTPRKYCSRACRLGAMSARLINRDMAVRIMNMRSQGMTWAEISNELMPGMKPESFRARLQKEKSILFSTAEQAHYFPKHGTPHYKPPGGPGMSDVQG